LFKDLRDYQILFLTLFLVLGIGTRDWTLRPELIGCAIATCLITQWFFSSLSLRSALITGLGISLLLRDDHWTTIALASFLAISSKFVFKVGDKHFFNPANFGIISVLILTNDAWVSPGQ